MTTDEQLTLAKFSSRGNGNFIDMKSDIEVFTMNYPFRNMKFPLRVNGLVIALVTSGKGRVGIDLRQYELTKGSILVIHPRNYIYSAEADDITLDVVACSLQVVENVLPKLTDLVPLLMHHRAEPVELLDDIDMRGLLDFYDILKVQYDAPESPFKKRKMMALLQAALFEMMDIHCRREEVAEHQKTRKVEIMARFIILVSENFRSQRQVGFYSEQLCVSSKHLSAVVKEISGRTAGEWIENYVTVEAKVLLRSTDLTIQEIASRLNFTNQSFFGKYFKHQTGMSPSEYRKSER